MYISRALWTNKVGKTYESIWLRESFRDSDGKVRNRSILNLKSWSEPALALLQQALDANSQRPDTLNKNSKNSTGPARGRSRGSKNRNSSQSYSAPRGAIFVHPKEISVEQGSSVGALFTVFSIAQRLGIVDALGHGQQAKLALWQVCSRVIEQGSRLSAVRMANLHAAASILGFERGFSENDLYGNLDWLDKNQQSIEDRLFAALSGEGQAPRLFLYDVTSSYLEGEKNEYARFGYNRDKKKGKRQIVIGLLCGAKGIPLSVEVFDGNTQDVKTVSSQLKKIRERFGCSRITFVGDRGMLKSASLSELSAMDFSYITGITRAQIETLITRGVLECGLFDTTLCEVECDGVRYIYRKNPTRAEEIAKTRQDKKETIEELCGKKNTYLGEHPRASAEVALKAVAKRIKGMNLENWLSASLSPENPRRVNLTVDEEKLKEASRLDGCYVLKTDIPASEAAKEDIHARYKDLANVEHAFHEMKTGQLELRPVHVRRKSSTRAHVLVVMLGYRITRELERLWKDIPLTVEEGLRSLTMLTESHVKFSTGLEICRVQEPSKQNEELLKAAEVILPPYLLPNDVNIHTHKPTKKGM